MIMYWELSQKFSKICDSLEEPQKSQLQLAYDFAYQAHLGQKRKSGEDYFIHPLAVGINLFHKFWNIDLVIAGLLHDTVEDNENIEIDEIYEKFGDSVWFMVDAVTKNTKQFYKSDFVFERKIDKFLYWWTQDIKVFILKLADRDDNLKTINNLKDNKQVRMAFETQAIFSPLEMMIDYKNISSVQQAHDNLCSHCKRLEICEYKKLKDYLISVTFNNFSNECFDSVYQNTANVTWKINSREVLDELLKTPNINDKIETLSIESWEHDYFAFMFRFKKWQVMNNDIKLEIWDTYSFSL